jgi:enoyl-CoA hydratase/carnithine racemase
MSEFVAVSQAGSLATITLNRPERLNALVPGMGADYVKALHAADMDPEVRGILVTGAGRGFCSGADISLLEQSPDSLETFVTGVEDLPTQAFHLHTPVATAINGPCAGVGFVLAICADARFVHPDATLTTSFARLGLVAEYGVAWVLPRLIGLPAATDLLLTGRTITGREAEALGMAVCADDPVEAARSWLQSIADHSSPTSVGSIKEQLLESWQMDLDASAQDSLRRMKDSFRRPDLAEALRARSEKRTPRFSPYERTPQ